MVESTNKETRQAKDNSLNSVQKAASAEGPADEAPPDEAASVGTGEGGFGSEDVCAGDSTSLDQELKRLEEELALAHDGALRAQAELVNFRKRSFRELEEERKFASLPLMRNLLPVVDNLERAIQAAEQSENSAGLLDGVKMVAQQLLTILEQHQCKRIDAKGSTFDPNMHEAIGQLHCETQPPGSIAEVALDGYQLHNRVVRPPQVFVSLGPAEQKEPN